MVDKITPTAYAKHRKELNLPGTTRQAVQKAISSCRLFDCVVDSAGHNHQHKDFDVDGRKYIVSADDADQEWANKTTRAPRNNPLSIDGTDIDQPSKNKKTNPKQNNKASKKNKKSDDDNLKKTDDKEPEKPKQVEFQGHKTRKEDAQASLAEIELAQKKKELLSKPELVNDLVIIANELRRALIKLPDSMCDDLAADHSPQKIRVKLRNSISLALTESAEAMKKLLPKKEQELITQQVELKL